MKTRTIFCAAIISVTFLPAIGPSHQAAEPETLLVSANGAGTSSGDSFSESPVISADGRFVTFESLANDLVASDTNDALDVFVRNSKTGATNLVSVNSAGTSSGNGEAGYPDISADGRFVAFESLASDLVANDTNGHFDDIFVRDLKTGTTTLVTVNSAGTGSGNSDSLNAVISAKGRFVAFYSFASDLVANDTNGASDVFVRDLKTGTTTLISVNSVGTDSGNGFSFVSDISSDGRFVAFESYASDLVENDTNGFSDVFVRDLKTGTTTLVSVNRAGTDSGNSASGDSVISPDGRVVAFSSLASDLVAKDTNGTFDVFVRDLNTGTTALVTVNSAGTGSGNSASGFPVISADGRVVAFQSFATDLVANGTRARDVFVRDLTTGTTSLVTVNRAGTGSGNGNSHFHAMSADGRFVAFDSRASDLVANDTNGSTDDIFLRDLKTGTTTLLSVNSASTGSGNNHSGDSLAPPAISADGRVVAFDSFASDLVANDTNGVSDVFVRRLKHSTERSTRGAN